MEDDGQNELIRKTAIREAKILKQLQHPNVVRLVHLFRTSARLCMVFEYMDRSIMQMLTQHPRGLAAAEVRRILWQMVLGLNFLHSQQIIHRDIKPENVLMDEKGSVKLCDFGFARPAAGGPGAAANLSPYVATRWYRAPELLVGDKYGPGVDIWALGCLLVELTTGKPIFPGKSNVDQLWLIMCSVGCSQRQLSIMRTHPVLSALKMPSNEESEAMSLDRRYPYLERSAMLFLKACLAPEPKNRPSAADLMNHEYFKGAKSQLAAYTEAHMASLQAALASPAVLSPPATPPERVTHAQAQPAAAASAGASAGGAHPQPVPPAQPRALQPSPSRQAHAAGTAAGVAAAGTHAHPPGTPPAGAPRVEAAGQAAAKAADAHKKAGDKESAAAAAGGDPSDLTPQQRNRIQAWLNSIPDVLPNPNPPQHGAGSQATGMVRTITAVGQTSIGASRSPRASATDFSNLWTPDLDLDRASPNRLSPNHQRSPTPGSPLQRVPSARNVLLQVAGPLSADPPRNPLLQHMGSLARQSGGGVTSSPAQTTSLPLASSAALADQTTMALQQLHQQLQQDSNPNRIASLLQQQLHLQPGASAPTSISTAPIDLGEGENMEAMLAQQYGFKGLVTGPVSGGGPLSGRQQAAIQAISSAPAPDSLEDHYAALKAALNGGTDSAATNGDHRSSAGSMAGRPGGSVAATGGPSNGTVGVSASQLSLLGGSSLTGAPSPAAKALAGLSITPPPAFSSPPLMPSPPPSGAPTNARRVSSTAVATPQDPLQALLHSQMQHQHMLNQAGSTPFGASLQGASSGGGLPGNSGSASPLHSLASRVLVGAASPSMQPVRQLSLTARAPSTPGGQTDYLSILAAQVAEAHHKAGSAPGSGLASHAPAVSAPLVSQQGAAAGVASARRAQLLGAQGPQGH